MAWVRTVFSIACAIVGTAVVDATLGIADGEEKVYCAMVIAVMALHKSQQGDDDGNRNDHIQ